MGWKRGEEIVKSREKMVNDGLNGHLRSDSSPLEVMGEYIVLGMMQSIIRELKTSFI